jgi:hypothetical protein
MSPIINLASNISRLSECRVVFGGNNRQCGNAIRFASADWSEIRSYVQNGGRLFLNGEHSGNHPATGTAFKCLQDKDNLNDFLSFLGSSIRYIGFDYNATGPNCSATYYSPGDAAIAQGINFTGERFGELSGGTSLWIGPAGTGGTGSGAGKVAAAIEQIGDGFLVVCGDSDQGTCEGACNFLRRLWEYADDQIL